MQVFVSSDQPTLEDIMEYCVFLGIDIRQGRLFPEYGSEIGWIFSCEDTNKLDFLLLRYPECRVQQRGQ